MNAFGPPLATHGPSKIVVSLFSLAAAGFLWLAWVDLHRHGPNKADERINAAAHLAFAIPLAAVALWTSRRRVVLYSEGFSYSTLWGEKELRWDDVDKFYYRVKARSAHFIPIGTYYWFRFVGTQGQKVGFGTGLANASSLGDTLVALTQTPLLKRAVTQFNSGATVDFGPIRVNRQSGVAVKKPWGSRKQIPWSEVQSFVIRNGKFYILRTGQKWATGPLVASIPNAFALLALLHHIYKSSDSSVAR